MKKRTPRNDTASQTRGDAFVDLVLNVALTQLAQVGFERLAIPQVAEQAGVNKTSIYRRWPTKENLVRDALAAAMRHTQEAPDTGALRGDLIALARTVADFAQSPVGMAVVRIMMTEGANPNVRALATMAYGQASGDGPWAVMQRATQRGELKHKLDPALVLFTVAGAVMHRIFVEQTDVSAEFLTQVVDLVLTGASTKT